MADIQRTYPSGVKILKNDGMGDTSAWLSVPFQVRIGESFRTQADVLAYRLNEFGDRPMSTYRQSLVEQSMLNDGQPSPVGIISSGLDRDRAMTLYNNIKKKLVTEDDSSMLSSDAPNKAADISMMVPVTTATGFPYYRDTRLGANDAINCVWQFNRDDDITHPINYSTPGNTIGEGRVYCSTIEAHQQIAWFTFGVPRFTDIASLLAGCAVEELTTMNNTGFSTKSLSKIFSALGTLAFALPIACVERIFTFIERFREFPVDKFTVLRPTMWLYYRYVDSFISEWLVDVGVYTNGNNTPSKGLFQRLYGWITNFLTSDNPQSSSGRPLDSYYMNNYQSLKTNTWTADKETIPMALANTGSSIWDILIRKVSLIAPTTEIGDIMKLSSKLDEVNDRAVIDPDVRGDPDRVVEEISKIEELFPEWTGSAGRLADGAGWGDIFARSVGGATEFVGFRVGNGTDASESFSNSTEPNQVAEKINGFMASRRSYSLSLGMSGAEGVQAGGGAIEQFVNTTMGTLDDITATLADAADLAGVADAVKSGAYIDVPEQYSSSSTSKSHSLTFQLRSPYGDPISIYQSIIVPLAMLLVGSLPRAAGANSYSSPFLCRVYCKGMFSVPLGIIESISIKRGNSDYGWTDNFLPTCIDVSVTIKDMSPVLYMVMHNDMWSLLWAGQTNYREYLLNLSGMGVYDRISRWNQLRRNIQLVSHHVRNTVFNPMFWLNGISEINIVQFIGSIFGSDYHPR